jgi:hypothetical protein
MNQALYAHMNNKRKRKKEFNSHLEIDSYELRMYIEILGINQLKK